MKTLQALIFFLVITIGSVAQDTTNYFERYKISDEEDWRKKRESYYINSVSLHENDIQSYYYKGIENMERGDYNLAISDFKMSKDIGEYNTRDWLTLTEEKNYHPIFFIGTCFNMLNQQDSALLYFQETVKKYPLFDEVYIELAKLYANDGQYELGLKYCNKLIELNKQIVDAHYIKALILYNQNDIKNSVKEVRLALKINPKGYFLYSLLGDIYYTENKETSAIKYFTKAIESDPKASISYLKRGLSYIKKMKYNLAFTDFMTGFKLDSTNLYFPLFMGYTSIRLNNVEAGIISLSKYIELEMANKGKYYSLSFNDLELFDLILYLNKYGSYDDEQKVGYLLVDLVFSYNYYKDYTFIITYAQENPKSVFASRVYNYLLFMQQQYNQTMSRTHTLMFQDESLIFIKVLNAKLKSYLNKHNEAIIILNRVIKQAPYYTAAFNDRAEAYIEIGDYTKAFRDFNYALKLNPDYLLARANRADLYFNSGNYRQALTDYFKLDITSPLLSKTIGQVYDNLNNNDSAIFHLSKAIEMDKNYHEAYHCRGKVYMKSDEPKKALADFNNSIIYKDNIDYYYFDRAMAEKELNMIDSVIFDLNKTLQINPDYSKAYGEIGWAYYLKGKYFDSIKYSMLMLQKSQGSFFAMYNLALAKLRLGNLESSRQFYIIFAEEDYRKNHSINQKAIDDLQYLIDNDIYKNTAQEILDTILNVSIEK